MIYEVQYFLASMDEEEQKQYIAYLREAIDTRADNFRSQLMRLCFKADVDNQKKLFAVYPREVATTQAWKSGIITPEFEVDDTILYI